MPREETATDEDVSSGTLSSGSNRTTAAAAAGAGSRGAAGHRRNGRKTLAQCPGAQRWRKHLPSSSSKSQRAQLSSATSGSSTIGNSPGAGTVSQSNDQLVASSDSSDDRQHPENSTPCSKEAPTPDSNASTDSNPESSLPPVNQNDNDVSPVFAEEENPKDRRTSSPSDGPFANLEGNSKADWVAAAPRYKLANMIEKAILDFCSSRTVETMRRMFVGVTSEPESLQGEGARQWDKSVQALHPVTAELVKEGIVFGSMDVFAPRIHRDFRLEMKDSLVEGFLTDAGVFRSICYRTKCQLEVMRRLLNRKLCTDGRWVKYLIVRIVGPSHRAISCCDQLLKKAVPAFKCRLEYPKAAYCRLFLREDIPDNTLLYSCLQRTGGSSNRYGALRLNTPYRMSAERTVGNCPWKRGALKVGKLSFSGSGGHMSMRQVYPGYGYNTTQPVEPACKGLDAVNRIEVMHNQFLTRRQLLLQDRRVMSIPVRR